MEVEGDLASTERSEFENLLSSFDLYCGALASLVNKLPRFINKELHIPDLWEKSVVECKSKGEGKGKGVEEIRLPLQKTLTINNAKDIKIVMLSPPATLLHS